MKRDKYEINEKTRAEFGGEIYYLRILGCDKSAPVVLFLHGGCGSPDRAHMLRYQAPLAKKFVLAAWDQTGSGLAYDKKTADRIELTKERIVKDAVNVIGYLKKRFGKEKIIVVGHSWGSVLGVWVAQTCPNDISAYVGVGQAVDYAMNEEASYLWTLEEAEKAGDKKAVATLHDIGAPKDGYYAGDHRKSQMKQRAILHKLGGATYANRAPYWRELLSHDVPLILREYGLSGAIKYVKGIAYSASSPMARIDPHFFDTARKLDVPVYLLLGRHDMNCVRTLATEWLIKLRAPEKRLILFENSAHSPQWEESEAWNRAFEGLFFSE